MDEDIDLAFRFATALRNHHVPTEIYMEQAKFAKKMTYANRVGTPLVAIIGEDEKKNNAITIKNMQSGEQTTLGFEEAVSMVVHFQKNMKELLEKPIKM